MAYRERFMEPLRAQAVALITEGEAAGRFRPVVPAEIIVDTITGALTLSLLYGTEPATAEDLLAIGRTLLGILVDPD